MKDQLATVDTLLIAKKKGLKPNIEIDYSDGTSWEEPVTLNMLQTWLRDTHQLILAIIPFRIGVSDKSGLRYSWVIVDGSGDTKTEDVTALGYLTYEEATEAGVLAGLELINVQ